MSQFYTAASTAILLIEIENILASGLNFFVVIAPPSKIPIELKLSIQPRYY